VASSLDFVNFVAEQLNGAGEIAVKKMFGEYMVYCNGKPVVLICDDTAFVKILPIVDDLLANAERGRPYNGAKEHYILDVDNRDLIVETITRLEQVIPLPKKKKKN
jgi:TfoX/Sxy family transcriptional regulator of competence genes